MTRRRVPLQAVEDAFALVGLVTVAATAAGFAILAGRAVEGALRKRNAERAVVLVLPTGRAS